MVASAKLDVRDRASLEDIGQLRHRALPGKHRLKLVGARLGRLVAVAEQRDEMCRALELLRQLRSPLDAGAVGLLVLEALHLLPREQRDDLLDELAMRRL